MNTIEQTIKNFITENFLVNGDTNQLDNNQSFLESGIIDSTGMMELVSFVEGQYTIKIEDEELIPDNLDSVNNVVRFINKKLVTQQS
jgi:acyl carrier protein